jgi:hypothetical protein
LNKAINFLQIDLVFDDLNLKEEDFEENIFARAIETEEVEYDLEPIREFIDEYVGMIITDLKIYDEGSEDMNEVTGKIMTGVSVDSNKIYMNLASLTGKPCGTIELAPSLTGHFVERLSKDSPVSITKYRLQFYGGFSIEYLDSESNTKPTFYEIHREISDFV